MKQKMEDISKVIVHFLINNGTFYASLLSQMRRVADPKMDGKMDVGIKNGRLELRYNPIKLAELDNMNQKAAICEHECEHIVKSHMIRQQDREMELWNIACDLAINQTIRNLPDTAIGLKDFPSKLGLKSNQPAEYYFEQLKKEGDKVEPNRQGDGSGNISIQGDNNEDGKEVDINNTDEHSSWGQDDTSQEMAEQIIKNTVKQAVEQTERLQGKIPAHLQEDIDELFKPPVIPWQQIARKWIGTRIKGKRRYSRKRPSRRFGEMKPGTLSDKLISILLVVDTSGSMQKEELQDAFNEIRGLLNCYKTKIYLMQVDAEVQSVEEVKPYQKISFKPKGRGGTSFHPAFKYVEDEKLPVDLIIYFTDLFIGNDWPPKPKQPVMWVTVSDKIEIPYGQLLSIPLRKQESGVYNRY